MNSNTCDILTIKTTKYSHHLNHIIVALVLTASLGFRMSARSNNNISFGSFPSTSDSCSWSPPTDIAELAGGANDSSFPTDPMVSSSTSNKGSVIDDLGFPSSSAMKSAKASTAVVLWETRAAHKHNPSEEDEDDIMKWRRLNTTNFSEAGFSEAPSFSSKPNNQTSLNEDKKAALRLSNISEAEEQSNLQVSSKPCNHSAKIPTEELVSPTGVDDFETDRVTASTKFQFSDALASSFDSDFTRLFDDAEFTLTDKKETDKERKASSASLLEQHLAYLSNTMKGGKMQILRNPSLLHSLLTTPTKKQEVDPTTSNSMEVSFSSQAYDPLMSCGIKDGMFAISCNQNAAVGVRSILQGFMPQVGTLADAVSEGYDMLASEFPEYLKPKSDVKDDA